MMKHNKTILGLILGLALAGSLYAQDAGRRNIGDALLVNLGYGVQIPGADLAERFGSALSLEAGVDYLTKESNWLIGLQGQYFFGANVKEDVLVNLRTADGFIIGTDASPAEVLLRERGWYLGGKLGRIFGLGKNPRSGIRVSLGAGLLQHKIRIQNDPVRTVNQLVGDYRKGYDRLTNGLTLHQFIGWQTLSRDGRINFYIGLEAFQGFTQNRRALDFATQQALTESRFDLITGLRVGWVLPFYMGEGEEIFY